ncbi:Succinyl-CoA:(R)-benzylsuccinate CoA-transferase subunit BbsF [Nonomuraea coxensis DSM 45129]|uniref:Succinyl-CoA:(R)-benzylsuccinate CoA-transferase subunit BbsF n=1 Tax=Nonomuraea coxensis DSM 45129 TaxID=1122611 RepID=A0ABX8U1C5_9ACTN|nr:CaiB/BaiF CoA-transferase family protein [Nonomuraea coxensis]QYC41545.1 Succinyl-CoA:(R)-benzylsuccinate CoA-transferase subunit BbsF [Nonomuraea coxensis DSM 45129]
MGPLTGVRVVELLGIGPGPFCGMVLADLGADVVRVERPVPAGRPAEAPAADILARGQRSVTADLKSAEGRSAVLGLVRAADVLIDPFRPGVTERLGLGPEDCLAANPRLVYGRMTGWGQEGPYAPRAGHDINYIALSGALSLCGNAGGPPVPPVNLLGDFGGGAMFLAVGVLAALLHARSTGEGQVVDAAMVDGSAALTAMTHQMLALGAWGPRGTNVLDTGAPYYNVYRAADGGWVSVGAIEDPFYAELLDVLGLAGDELATAGRHDRERWPDLQRLFAGVFATRTRAEWAEAFAGRDACFAPVWELAEAQAEPHLAQRGTYVREFGVTQPAPAPRFSRTPAAIGGPPPHPGQHTGEVFRDWGVPLPGPATPTPAA